LRGDGRDQLAAGDPIGASEAYSSVIGPVRAGEAQQAGHSAWARDTARAAGDGGDGLRDGASAIRGRSVDRQSAEVMAIVCVVLRR